MSQASRHAPPRHSILRHSALNNDLGGVPLAQARLTDQQRLAILLQGTTLLSHLEHGGWFLPRGWEGATVHGDTLLGVDSVEVGTSVDLPQVLLQDLLKRLFSSQGHRGQISGKGLGRSLARLFQQRWRQYLVPISPDQAVAEILEKAHFLWQPAFAQPRKALLAEYGEDETSVLWVAGPGPNRGRFLARSTEYEEIANLLASPRAEDLWDGWRIRNDPVELAEKRRYRQAANCWRRRPPSQLSEVILYARCLVNLGSFTRAEEVLRNRRQFEASLLRLQCLMELGRQTACQQLIARMIKRPLAATEMLDLAELAVRSFSLQGQNDQSLEWVNRAFRAGGKTGLLRARAELLAAEAAWDRNELELMARHLSKVRSAHRQPGLVKRWHEVHSLYAVGMRDGAEVIEHSSAVLRHRAHMSKTAAGRRWNDLAYGRLLIGDLPGAERAIGHAHRLLAGTESVGRSTLGFSNLAGIRLRRGRAEGVEEALKVSMAENRRLDNHRGLVGDLELCVRLELVMGRLDEALLRCEEAFELIREHGVGDRQVFDLFAARAYGWLGAPDRAAASLARVSPEILFELEPEERPAIWALSGHGEEAAREAVGTPWAELWSAQAMGLKPRPAVWDELEQLESFRAARLIFDVLTVARESVPPAWVSRAIESLRRVGAGPFVNRIESRFCSPWRAVQRYLESWEAGKNTVANLFDSAGFPEAKLSLIVRGRELFLKEGPGGEQTLEAPFENGKLVLRAPIIDSVLEALFHLARRDVKLPEPRDEGGSPGLASEGILGESQVLKKAFERIDQLARGEIPLLILGESGTGKEKAAQRVHQMSQRSQGPFQPVNCAGLPEENLVHSALFGHRKGAFTGADRNRPGLFEQARGGTIFLDEIGDLPLGVQGTLLRVLQEGEVRRLGDEVDRRIDVRVVAATHRPLTHMVRSGKFREDLFFRLKGAAIELPALRERGQDVVLLAEHFLRHTWSHQNPDDSTPPKISPEAGARLLRHSWPGNIRELQQTIKHAVTFAEGRFIRVADLGLEDEERGEKGGYHHQLAMFKRQLVRGALKRSQGNRAEAARSLDLTRQALSYLARQLDLNDADL